MKIQFFKPVCTCLVSVLVVWSACASQSSAYPCLLKGLEEVREYNKLAPFAYQSAHSKVKAYSLKNNHKLITKKDLTELDIPTVFHEYFDGDGNFNYRPTQIKSLALENGDQELSMLRMNYTSDIIDPYISRNYLSDYQLKDLATALGSMPNAELVVSYTIQQMPHIRAVLGTIHPRIKDRIRLVRTNIGKASFWTQDSSKPLDSNQTLLPVMSRRYSDRHLLIALARQQVIEPVQSSFFFEGGNIIVGKKHVFMGQDLIDANADMIGASPREIVKALSLEFGKEVIPVHQTDYHIDLTFAVVRDRHTGKEVILMASQELAIDLLFPGQVKQSLKNLGRDVSYEDLLAAHGDKKFSFFKDDERWYPELENLWFNLSYSPWKFKALAKRTSALRRQKEIFQQMGYEVKEIPDLGLVEQRIYKDENARSPSVFNYTNSIFSGEHAIIPKMGLQLWDDYVKQVLVEMGYRPHQVTTPRLSICALGGMRCLTETYRHPAP